MPDILTHILQGEDVFKSLRELSKNGNDPALTAASAISARPDLFFLGTQGPDIFYYHGFWPWQRKRSLSWLGNKLHLEKTGAFFSEGFRYLSNLRPVSEKAYNELFSYLCGCICHWALDRNAHPYIYSSAGYDFSGNRETGKYYYKHQKLEVIIDCILLKKKKNKEAFRQPIHSLLQLQGKFPSVVGGFYRDAVSKLYGLEINGKDVHKACSDMRRVFRLIYDPLNIKKVFVDALNKILYSLKGLKVPRPLHPSCWDNKADYLNINRRQWCHPLVKDQVNTSSFEDILENSVQETVNLILKGTAFLQGKSITPEKIYLNLSYLTNKESGSEAGLKHVSSPGILDGSL